MNLTLIGMAGAGKSYIGKQLAQQLSLTFTDIDDYLEEKYDTGIQAQLDEIGEQAYLEREMNALIEATRARDGLLISPGGSVIYRYQGMDHVKDISAIVYLQAPYETIEERLRKVPPRAVIGLGRKSLRELYDERHPLYELHADFSIEVAAKPLDAVIGEILRALASRRLIPSDLA